MSEPTSQPAVRHTSLYAEHVALNARLVPFAGWEMPVQYTGIVDEHQAVRNAAGLFDVSHMGELRLRGPFSMHVVDYLVTNDVKKVTDGQAIYTCACNEQGTILDDLIVYRREAEDWLVVCNGSNREKMSAHFARAAKDHCDFDDQSDGTALLALQGPRAMDVMCAVPGDGVRIARMESFRFGDATIAGVPVTAARTGYTGEDGVELFCAWDAAPTLWRALLGAGEALGCKPVGLGARDTLRLEACLSLYGNELDETTHPIEAGLARTVKLEKGDFVGRAALQAVVAAPLTRKLVGFEMSGRGIARHGYPLLTTPSTRTPVSTCVGLCTSGSPGPTVGKNIGLGYLPTAMSALGTPFLVDCRGKSVEAVVVKTPFYKRHRPGANR